MAERQTARYPAKTLGAALVLVCLAGSSIAQAEGRSVAVGPSAAWGSVGHGAGFLPGLDLTCGGTFGGVHPWASVGTRAWLQDNKVVIPYAEVGVWLLINAGIGYSFLIPTDGDAVKSGAVMEPYVRPTFLVQGSHETVGEGGVLLKVWWHDTGMLHEL